jgi:hypothetical protein
LSSRPITIGGSVSINGTSGNGPFPEDQGAEIEGNVIGGSLACGRNTPAAEKRWSAEHCQRCQDRTVQP